MSLVYTSSAESALQWSFTFGSSKPEAAYSVIQTIDNGYAVVGYTYHSSGWCTLWIVKLDASGNKQWNQTLDDHAIESPYLLIQTSDGGYAIAGSNAYYSAGYNDFKLFKTDSSGQVQWSKTYSGGGDERAYSIVQSSDEGYAMAGYTWSSSGSPTFWLVKVDSSGEEQWTQTYDYSDFSTGANCVIATNDGGYALAGYVALAEGREDFRLVKTDALGNLQWNQTYGGSDKDVAYSIVQTADGGYAFAGYSGIDNIRGDFYLVKTDSAGKVIWDRSYGDVYEELGAYSLVSLNDGGFALAGGLGLGDQMNAVRDFLLIRTDASGVQLWNQTYGGSSDDYATSMIKTNDGAYALLGPTESGKILLLKTEKLEINPITTSPSTTNSTPSSSLNPTQSPQETTSSPNSSSVPESSPSVPEFPNFTILVFLVICGITLLTTKWKLNKHVKNV